MKITRQRLEPFLRKYATDEPVLDIGAGNINTNHSYTQFFPNRHTVDVDQKRLPDTVADVHALPFKDGSQTCIVCTEVLEHCMDPQKAIHEMHRALALGGRLILTTRFVYPLHDVPHDYFRFTKYGLEHLFRDWEIIELMPETASFSALGALLERIGFQTTVRGGKLTKLFIYSFAKLLTYLDWIIVKEYGDIGRTVPETNIMATGYYIVARKK